MQLFQKNESVAALRGWFFACVDDTDGKTPETGLTFSGAELQISKCGNAFASFAGSVTEIGDGLYWYTAHVNELDTNGALAFKVEQSGVRLVLMQVGQVVRWDPYSNITETLAALPTAAAIGAAVWAVVIEGSHTAGDLVRGMIGQLVGRVTDFTTGTLVFKSLDAAKTRWTITTNATGRLTVTPGDLT